MLDNKYHVKAGIMLKHMVHNSGSKSLKVDSWPPLGAIGEFGKGQFKSLAYVS